MTEVPTAPGRTRSKPWNHMTVPGSGSILPSELTPPPCILRSTPMAGIRMRRPSVDAGALVGAGGFLVLLGDGLGLVVPGVEDGVTVDAGDA